MQHRLRLPQGSYRLQNTGATPMTVSQLSNCISEAQRFVNRAIEARVAIERETGEDGYQIDRHIETAAALRASLDLTRALAQLRRRT
jgi:hypothetical protein